MPGVEKGLVTAHQEAGAGLYEMTVKVPAISKEAGPGQFVHIRPGITNDPLLRRPLSIFDADRRRGSISLLYKVVGRGTDLLARVREREYIDIMGPLGHGFTLPEPGLKVLLVGGGVGVAPLVYLARSLKERGNPVKAAYGVASRCDAGVYERKFSEMGVFALAATMDGSQGYKGTVTRLLQDKVRAEEVDMIFTCGPEAMMTEVVQYADKHGIKGEASLEEYMACGVGACLGCARRLNPVDSEYVKVCRDGPVFAMSSIRKD